MDVHRAVHPDARQRLRGAVAEPGAARRWSRACLQELHTGRPLPWHMLQAPR